MRKHAINTPIKSLALVGALALAGCQSANQDTATGPAIAPPQAENPWQDWQSNKDTSPLLGKIWSTHDQAFITPAQLSTALAARTFVLLGETHDNADHHLLQAWAIDALAAKGRNPAIVWEMFDSGQSAAMADFLSTDTANAQGLGPAVKWEDTGWPSWSLYQPVAEAAFSANLPMVAGNAPIALVRKVGKDGYDALPRGQSAKLLLDRELGDVLEPALRTEIVASHCDLIPLQATGPMFRGQRVRDAFMAEAMLAYGQQDGAVLIAGSGHVRTDRAVPWVLRQHQPDADIASLVFKGVEPQDDDIDALGPLNPEGNIAADYVWYTPKKLRDDPCVALKAKFAK